MNGFGVGRQMDDTMFHPNGRSTLSSNDDRDRDSYSSSICEITDCESRDSSNLYHTTTVLRVCRQQVLKPYWKLLFVIGWRPFGRDRINYHCGWKALNVIYPLLLVALMFYVYAYRILSCQGKYDVPLIVPSTDISPTIVPHGGSNVTTPMSFTIEPAAETYHICTHLISSYVFPDVLHFLAFLLGFWYFRIQDNEQMDAMIQQAFLHTTPIQHGTNTQSTMIRAMKWILICGALWVVGMMGVLALFLTAFGLESTIYPFFSVQAWNIVLLGVNVFGCLIYNSIIAAVVVNYTVQCETIICFMRSIQEQLLEKTGDLRMIMHDILKVWQATHQLNGPMANMMSLLVFNFAAMVVVGVSLLLFQNQTEINPLVLTYRVCFFLLWLVILVFPFVQAARLSSIYNKIEQAALEMRVFGYLTSTPRDLDSFLQFVTLAKYKVRLLFIPVDKSLVYGILLLTTFLLIVLVQTGIIVAPSLYL
ncbi:uncharacterized protein LOC110980762 [Acanthaster planci]|uniref:Uncharacterized protein LOC110980762 n=1 Tax=Acanthaster planci TaxID=133434 RepID=A0A8B7YJH6_ACAPL|nr:uncharacterized protein LOC110980762 [Acanthaster planci]XP_022093405.1 uncharacterized protein LOC110980762 [Acanthaster planci]XP_022093406.1 uncharacterized protein LOC110980762 [Acanthaster planci]XP_022093407.1 uncharacterized protein LOC110980762 [Acanthaster planci]XP_022093408.1 uncharacterized protein LOC110980762 [Acanthaster planci]XP_022093409.1 uncharacterized protein LOC110980762 [Acanthaster planci]